MNSLNAILVTLLAVLLGCALDAGVKYLVLATPLLVVLAWRYLFGAIITISLMMVQRRARPSWSTIRFQVMRGVLLVVTAMSFFYAVTQLTLVEATVIGFSAALMVAPLARLLLKEPISPLIMGATVFGFLGVVFAGTAPVLIEGEWAPAPGNRQLGVLAALFAAAAYALGLVLIRMRAKNDDALTMVTFSNVVPAIVLSPVLFLSYTTMTPSLLMSIVALAITGVLAWWLMSWGYLNARAQTLAPLEYTALLWSSLLGYQFFRETPHWALLVGAVLIVAACLVIAFEGRFATRRGAKLPVSDILD